MAYPKWYNEEQKRLHSLHEQVEAKEQAKTQTQNEIDFKKGLIAQLEAEIADINREIAEPKLPLLLLQHQVSGHYRQRPSSFQSRARVLLRKH